MYDFLLVAGVVLWGGLLAWYLRHPLASAFHPVTFYLVFHGVLFTIRPILARLGDYDNIYRAFGFTPVMRDKIIVLVAADLALVVFVAVALRVGNVAFSRAAGTAQREAEPRFTRALWLTFALCLPLAGASLLRGGNTMITDISTGIAINTSGSGYLTDAMLMLGPLAVLFAWAGRFRLWAFAPLALFVLVKAGTGGRWPFVMAAMSAGLFWMYERRLRWFTPRILFGAALLLALFSAIGTDRGAAVRSLFGGETLTQTRADYFALRPLESMDYANMEFFEYIVGVIPARTGTYDYFLNNLQVLTEPIPRLLWPGKPIGAPIQRFQLGNYGSPIGMTASVPGAGWLQAGWIGVVLWSAFFAWLYGTGYRLFVQSDQSRFKTAAFIILTPVALQTFRDGVLLTVLKTSFFPLLPVLVWWGMSRIVPEATAPQRRPVFG